MIKKALVSLVFLLVVSGSDVSACDCWSGATPCQDFWKASAVFKGTVIYSSPTTYKRGEHDFSGRLVRFTIDQSFRGVTGNEVEVMTGLGGGDCGYSFRLGGQYIVYALRDGEKLTTSIDMPYRKETDSEGRFSFKVYEGINYDLKAYLDIAKGIRKQAERSLRISSDSEILKLILE